MLYICLGVQITMRLVGLVNIRIFLLPANLKIYLPCC